MRLVETLDRHPTLSIAVSGGVDSMTLAYVAHLHSNTAASMVHAVSPAVPGAATARVRDYARRFGWDLRELDAREFQDPNYVANPVNRCYFCKSNLYDRVREATVGTIASGTNLDDLGDFRPGLHAAAERDVAHPFVEAGLRKSDIYDLARQHGLNDLSALPAQPCLASRVETGIAIDPIDLGFIEEVEKRLSDWLPGAAAIRCRITRNGVRIECDPLPAGEQMIDLNRRLTLLCVEAGRNLDAVTPYRRGSAFLRNAAS
jgi:uncharacterized protein